MAAVLKDIKLTKASRTHVCHKCKELIPGGTKYWAYLYYDRCKYVSYFSKKLHPACKEKEEKRIAEAAEQLAILGEFDEYICKSEDTESNEGTHLRTVQRKNSKGNKVFKPVRRV